MTEKKMMMMKIRKIQVKDVPTLRKNIFDRCTDEQLHEMLKGFSNEIETPGKKIMLVAIISRITGDDGGDDDDAGEVIGCAQLERGSSPLTKHRAEIESVVVKEGMRRKGICRSMLDACEEESRRVGLKSLVITCRGGEPPEIIYQRCGFTICGRIPRGLMDSESGQTWDEVILHKPLL